VPEDKPENRVKRNSKLKEQEAIVNTEFDMIFKKEL
jgi:hypothetical protein